MKLFLYFLLSIPLAGWGQTNAEKANPMNIHFITASPGTPRIAWSLKVGSDTLIIDPEFVHFLRIGSRTYRIVRPEAFIEEVATQKQDNTWINGQAVFMTDSAFKARFWSQGDSGLLGTGTACWPFPSPYVYLFDKQGNLTGIRNRGTIAGQPEIIWFPTSAPDTTSKKHPKKKQ